FLNIVGIAYAVTGFGLILASVFFNKRLIQNPAANFILRWAELLLMLPVLSYTIWQQWYLPAAWSAAGVVAVTLAMYFETASHKPKHIRIDNDGVLLPRPGRNMLIQWQDIQRLIIKHNIITIDCRNNKLFQYYINNPE